MLLSGIRPLDVGIILDQTVALETDEWTAVLRFLKRVVNGLGVSPASDGARIGLIRFTSNPSIPLYFNTLKDEHLSPDTVNKFIDKISQSQGVRRIDLALQSAATDLFSKKGGSRLGAKKVMQWNLMSKMTIVDKILLDSTVEPPCATTSRKRRSCPFRKRLLLLLRY